MKRKVITNSYFESSTYLGEETPKVKSIVIGENNRHDYIIREILELPTHAVKFMQTNRILPPINYIGGKSIRMTGDTCRMFFYVKHMGVAGEYFFWDGIVPVDLPLLDVDERCKPNKKAELYFNYKPDVQNSFGISTGCINFRMVLIEKIKKANTLRAGLYEGRYEDIF